MGSTLVSGPLTASVNENSITFNVKQQPDFEELRDAVEDAIRALPEDIEDSEAPALGLDELEKLAYLKDKGIITAKEFEAKKKQILGL